MYVWYHILIISKHIYFTEILKTNYKWHIIAENWCFPCQQLMLHKFNSVRCRIRYLCFDNVHRISNRICSLQPQAQYSIWDCCRAILFLIVKIKTHYLHRPTHAIVVIYNILFGNYRVNSEIFWTDFNYSTFFMIIRC